MLQSVLGQIRSWFLANTGTYFDEIYDHVRIVTDSDDDATSFPANWEDYGRDPSPVLADWRRNYGYLRPLGAASASTEPGLYASCTDGQVWTIPIRFVIHAVKKDNGETGAEIALTMTQFLGNYEWARPSGSIIAEVNVNPTGALLTREEVVSEEITGELMPDMESELSAVDFDLVISFQPGCTIESSLCLGSLPSTFTQVSPDPLNVTNFIGGCVSMPRATAITTRDAGQLSCGSIYYITDENLYLVAPDTDRFAISGWIQNGTGTDAIEYDIDANEVYWRRNENGLEARYSPFYISIFGNPIASLPWSNSAFQNCRIVDSVFTHSGYSGPFCGDLEVLHLSSLDISGCSNTISAVSVKGSSVVAIASDGAVSSINASGAVVTLSGTSTSFSNIFADGGSAVTSTVDGKTLSGVWSQNVSSLVFAGTGGTMTNVRVDGFSDATIESTVSINDLQCVSDSSCTIAGNSGALTRISIISSSFEISISNTGAMSDFEITEAANVTFINNSRSLSDLKIESRECDFLNTFNPTTGARISAFDSNTYGGSYTVTGGGILSPDLALTDNHIGIIRFASFGTALNKITSIDQIPTGARVRFEASSALITTITNTAVGAASGGQFVGDVASITHTYRTVSPDYSVYVKRGTGVNSRLELETKMLFI